MKERMCQRCGYKWTSRVKEPRCCPYCKSHKWNEGDEGEVKVEYTW